MNPVLLRAWLEKHIKMLDRTKHSRYVYFLAVKRRICISTPSLQLVNVRREICRTRPGWSSPPGQGDSSSSSFSLRSSYSVRGGKESPLFPKNTLLTKGEYQNQNITFYHTYTLCFIWILEVYSFNLHITYEIKMSSGLFKPCVSLCCMYSDRETLVQDRSYDHIDQYHRKPSFKVEDRRIQTVNK